MPGRSTINRRSAVVLMAVNLALVGCVGAGAQTTVPSSSASPTAEASGAIPTASTPTLTSGPSPTPTVPIASVVDPVLVLRVESRPDVSYGRFPALSVFRDGTVLIRTNDGGRVAKLTLEGVTLLVAEAERSNLFAVSGTIPVDPTWQAGFNTSTIDLRRGQKLIHRSTTNAMAPARRAEGNRIIALAEHLTALETWLPATVWLIGPTAALPYIPAALLLKVSLSADPTGSLSAAAALDVDAVQWPLRGSLADFGKPISRWPGDVSTSRCGVISLAEAWSVQSNLAAAWSSPAIPPGDRMSATLGWKARQSYVELSLASLLPDDPRDCSIDLSWP